MESSTNLTKFIGGLEEKKRIDTHIKLYNDSPYLKRIWITLKKYGSDFYLSSKDTRYYNFDFPLDDDDIDYFINKYKPMIPIIEKKEKTEELRKIKRDKEKLERKIIQLENDEQL